MQRTSKSIVAYASPPCLPPSVTPNPALLTRPLSCLSFLYFPPRLLFFIGNCRFKGAADPEPGDASFPYAPFANNDADMETPYTQYDDEESYNN